MSDPTRFTDDHPSELARSLLAAGLDDEPSPALLERTLAPLGIGVAVAAAAETARAATTGATALATSTAPAAATTTLTSSLFVTTVKWVGIAGIGGGLVVGAAATLSPSSEPSTALRTAAHASTAPIAAPARGTPPAPAAPVEPPREEVISEPVAPERNAPQTPPPSPARGARASVDAEATQRSALLAQEAKVIDEAREAVATGDGARALRALRAHRATFDKPLLKPEALFLEMRALAAQGNTEAATRVAEELLRRYPKGPQAAAARSFLRTAPP